MGFKRKSHPVHPRDLEVFARYLTFYAILIAAGFITDWPHAWTQDGLRSRRRNSDERGRYDGDSVLSDAYWKLKYSGDMGVVWKPFEDGKMRPRVGLMKGDTESKEEGDL